MEIVKKAGKYSIIAVLLTVMAPFAIIGGAFHLIWLGLMVGEEIADNFIAKL